MERARSYDAPESAPRPTPFADGRDPAAADDGPSPADAVKEAASRFAELKEYAGYFVAAKVDGLKVTLRNVAIYAALGLVGGIVGIAVLIAATVMLLNGLSGLIAEIFPEKWEHWGGDLVLGLLLVGGAAAAVIFGLKSITGSSRKRTIEKYENRTREERRVYGHDVHERAAEQERLRRQEQAGA
jgi:hypothetical protein